MTIETISSMLREKKLRATPGRVKLFQILFEEKKPLQVEEIHKRIGVKNINEVTLYRALESFEKNDLVKRVDLKPGRAQYYELAAEHHHHIVCTDCGTIEDFSHRLCETLAHEAKRKSNRFKIIKSHSMELFGLCRNCS